LTAVAALQIVEIEAQQTSRLVNVSAIRTWPSRRFDVVGAFAGDTSDFTVPNNGIGNREFPQPIYRHLQPKNIVSLFAAIAKQERVRISERTMAGLERAQAKGRVGGRPRIKRERDKDAKRIRQLRDDGQSYSEISRSDIARVCQTLNCASASSGSVIRPAGVLRRKLMR